MCRHWPKSEFSIRFNTIVWFYDVYLIGNLLTRSHGRISSKPYYMAVECVQGLLNNSLYEIQRIFRLQKVLTSYYYYFLDYFKTLYKMYNNKLRYCPRSPKIVYYPQLAS